MARAILAFNGIETNSPRMSIKEAFKQGLMEDGEAWISMLEDRNRTSHLYDEAEALRIYGKIKEVYFPLLENFTQKISVTVSRMENKS